MGDYNRRFKSLKVLQDNVGARTQSFGDSYRFFFNKESAYTMTDQERLAKKSVDSIRKDLTTVSTASATKPVKTVSAATVPRPETSGTPVSTIKKDSA